MGYMNVSGDRPPRGSGGGGGGGGGIRSPRNFKGWLVVLAEGALNVEGNDCDNSDINSHYEEYRSSHTGYSRVTFSHAAYSHLPYCGGLLAPKASLSISEA